jgi:hypothetical protein
MGKGKGLMDRCSDSTMYFPILQVLTFLTASISLILNFMKPFYMAKRNAQKDDCPRFPKRNCESDLIIAMSPFEFEVKESEDTCIYSCPFSPHINEFRGSLDCLTITFCLAGAALRLAHHSWSVYTVWQLVLTFLSVAYFSLFVLSADATSKGYDFCMDDFQVQATSSGKGREETISFYVLFFRECLDSSLVVVSSLHYSSPLRLVVRWVNLQL